MTGNILIADDVEDHRELIAALLDGDSYTFIHATNGREALAVIERDAIDLIILDILMPVMDGFEFLEELARRDLHPPIPVLVSSAVGGFEAIERALRLGAADYFRKPMDVDVRRLQLPLKARNLIRLRHFQRESVEKHQIEALMATAGMANHEINQPLQAILAKVQLMLMQTPPTEPLHGHLKEIEESTLAIAEIVAKIGRINRFSTREYTADTAILDLDKAIDG